MIPPSSKLSKSQLLSDIQDRRVLIGTHGFNVNRADGIACLSNWEGLLQFAPTSVFVGLLWPGDSIWAHGLDYPEEPRVANEAGGLIAPFPDASFGCAASISFASHSLGARVVLETVSQMSLPVGLIPSISHDPLTFVISTRASSFRFFP
jgi:esterase/lipase superfamily enzyme